MLSLPAFSKLKLRFRVWCPEEAVSALEAVFVILAATLLADYLRLCSLPLCTDQSGLSPITFNILIHESYIFFYLFRPFKSILVIVNKYNYKYCD